MNKTILKVVVWFCIMVGVCLGVYTGYSIVPFSDDLGPLLSCVIQGAIFGGAIGGGLGATFVYVVTAERNVRRGRIVLVLAVGLGVFLLLTYVLRREPVECNQIQESEFRTLLKSDSTNITQVKQLLTKSSLKDEIAGTDYGDGRKVLHWRTNKAEYSAQFRDNLLMAVDISWDLGRLAGLKPTAEEVLACFDSPDLYQTLYLPDFDGNFVELSLWYLQKGIIVSSKRILVKNQRPIIDGNMIMSGMTLTAPNSAEEIIRNIYPNAEEKDEFRAEVLETLHPWPGSWGEVIVKGCKECPN